MIVWLGKTQTKNIVKTLHEGKGIRCTHILSFVFGIPPPKKNIALKQIFLEKIHVKIGINV